ncbi:MAG: hypothetical protein WC455_14945 [Dehalococcoidia bacterium]|jgi:hypothetical protein
MAKVSLHKHTLKLREGDYDALMDFYPETGAAFAIRKLVARHVDKLRSSTVEALRELESSDVTSD